MGPPTVSLADRQRCWISNSVRRVRFPQDTLFEAGLLGDRLTVGRLPLKQVVKVRILLPKLEKKIKTDLLRDSCCW